MYRHSRIIQYVNISLFLLFALSCASRTVTTKLEEPKSQLFVSSNRAINRALSARADEFAPQTYTKAVMLYQKAERDFEKGKDTEKIQERLEEAEDLARQSLDLSKTMRSNFSELVESRDKSNRVNADEMNLASYEKGEKYFLKTAVSIEKNGMHKARKSAEIALQDFQKAELEAIQKNIVDNLNQQLSEAEKQGADKWSPETYQTAMNYRDKAVEILEQNRYDRGRAKKQAQMGEYYARKAMYLTDEIKELKEDSENLEKIFLSREEELQEIASPLGLQPSFDEGFKEPVFEISQAVEDLKGTEEKLKNRLSKSEQILSQAQQQIRQSEQAKKQITSQLKKTELTLRERKMMEEKIQSIIDLFPEEEGKVSIDPENNITIILTGLNFDSGKATLKSEDYPLLSDVYKAARMFPDRKIRVVGHTDSTGSAEFNQRLSQARAEAVSQFMEKGLGVPSERIEVQGAGESNPIAPNNTPEGRKMNRRIEVTFLAK